MTETEQKVLDIVAKECRLDRATLTLDSRLEDLKIESIDLMQTIFQIEETFDIYVPQESENFKLTTLRDVTDAVARLIEEKQAKAS